MHLALELLEKLTIGGSAGSVETDLVVVERALNTD